MNKKLINSQSNRGGRSLQCNLNDIILQLHAGDRTDPDSIEAAVMDVDNPYTFSITKNITFKSPILTPEKDYMITVHGTSPWYSSKWTYASKIIDLVESDGRAKYNLSIYDLDDLSKMFFICQGITFIDFNLSIFNTHNVTNMSDMFAGCIFLENIIGIDFFDTSKVTDMSYMFANSGITDLDLSNWNIGKTKMNSMFYYCTNLKYIKMPDISSDVTSVANMFEECRSLTSLDLSMCDFSNVDTFQFMFYNCMKLEYLNLDVGSTSKVFTMDNMFNNCTSLIQVDCPEGLDCDGCTNMTNMFYKCPHFESPIHLKNVSSLLIESGSSPSDWVVKNTKGTRGVHYIVDSVI